MSAAGRVLQKLIPATLFGRLLLLLMVCVVASHVLALTLMFELHPFGPPHDGMPPPHHRNRPSFDLGLLLDIGIRMAALTLAAWIGARWLSRPMKQLADAAQSLGQNLHGPEMSEAGPRECRETTRVFNQMQGRLRQQLDERDQFVAAVSHDLRTPLTRLRLRVEEIASHDMKKKLGSDIHEMDEMITTTLDYLRGAADEEARVMLDIDSLVQSIADDEIDAGALVRVSGTASPVLAQALAVRRAIRNLVQNAIAYGGSADVHVVESASTVFIDVSDEGSGIPEGELASVVLPFYRVDQSRNRGHRNGGIGLGLSIVNGIAQRHGGRLRLANKPSGGLVATLEIPRNSRPLAA